MGRKKSEGLHETLRKKRKVLTGINNGIELRERQERHFGDCFLDIPEEERDEWFEKVREAKENAKTYVQRSFGLEQKRDAPLITVVSRITAQKSFNLIIEVAESLLKKKKHKSLQILIIGNAKGNEYEEKLCKLARKYPGRFVFPNIFISDDHPLYLYVYLAGDIYWMPSKYEPCGISQLEAMAAGQVVVASKTGGLKNTVFETDQDGEGRNGYLFIYNEDNYKKTCKDFYNATERALIDYYEQKPGSVFYVRQQNALKRDSSWQHTALKYIEAFKKQRRRFLHSLTNDPPLTNSQLPEREEFELIANSL